MPRYHLLTWNFLIKKLHVKLEFLKLEFLINKTQALMGYPKWRKSRIPYWEASHCKPDWEASHCKSINQDVDLPYPYHTTHADLNTRIFQMPNNTNNIKFQKKIIQKKIQNQQKKRVPTRITQIGNQVISDQRQWVEPQKSISVPRKGIWQRCDDQSYD